MLFFYELLFKVIYGSTNEGLFSLHLIDKSLSLSFFVIKSLSLKHEVMDGIAIMNK